jgi:hypothetical protein
LANIVIFAVLPGNYSALLALKILILAPPFMTMPRFTFQALILLFLTAASTSKAQVSVKDSSISTPLIGFTYGIHLPGGDLAKRFGPNSDVALSYMHKTKKNWIYTGQMSYLFGKQVKENTILDSIRDSNGQVINQNGNYADVRLYQRGFNIYAGAGRLFPMFGPNPNSGILVMGGVGLLQHKIRIEDIGNQSPQLAGDYKKGYDRLTNGISVNEFIGYLYLSNKRLVNFYAGFDLTQAFTQSRRSWDYDLMRKDETKRTDLLWGVRAGWVLPLYKRAENKFYYF